jgi:hypothetical protein
MSDGCVQSISASNTTPSNVNEYQKTTAAGVKVVAVVAVVV